MKHTEILLSTVNARYSHAAFGLRWLLANLGPLRPNAALHEFTFDHAPLEIAETVLGYSPRIVAFSVHIWNLAPIAHAAQILKRVRPEITLVVGGPEAAYEYENTPLFEAADYLVRGEGEHAFAALAQAILDGAPPTEKVIVAEPPRLDTLALPYDEYTDEDLQHRLTYVEASRGCPFGCEFCISSLEPRVREFPLEPFLAALERLLERGARRFKFVDRTFNLRRERMDAVFDFFQSHDRDDMTVHFEIVPDRLDEHMMERIASFPPGRLHLEAGIQSCTPAALEAIGRKQDTEKALATLAALRENTGARIHADLIAGLPHDTWDTFAASFDRVVATHPHELQVGILKRLKGTTIGRHPIAFASYPPYEALQTETLSFTQFQRIKRFARYFDLYYNAGNFELSLPLLWKTRPSAFEAFMALSDTIWNATGRTHKFSLTTLFEYLFHFLLEANIEEPIAIARILKEDYYRLPGRKECLELKLTPNSRNAE